MNRIRGTMKFHKLGLSPGRFDLSSDNGLGLHPVLPGEERRVQLRAFPMCSACTEARAAVHFNLFTRVWVSRIWRMHLFSIT
mmetsp:Transcript_6165/g.12670  ORF Transcript_6165/g.12670 Transcript_6165/m.12670 type:complete len:82 (-) Transcript_6165:851-1096(-)